MKILNKISENALTKAAVLTNEQMQAVAGGIRYVCHVDDPDTGITGILVDASNAQEAYREAILMGYTITYCEPV